MASEQVLNGQAMAIIAVSAILSALATLAVILRFLARIHKSYRYYLDDYLVVGGLILTLGVTINNILGVVLAGIGEDEVYRTSGAVGFPLAEDVHAQGQVMFALQILHTCAMPLIKASILAFYVRLFPTRRFKLAVKVVFAYVFCWWISVLFATVFQCSPISHNWATEPSQLSGCDSNIMTMYEIAAFTNFVGDIAVLGLPVPIIAGLHMPSKRKVALLGIFLTGSLVVVAGIGRTVAYFRITNYTDHNYSRWYYSLVIWTSVEPCLGIISACLPTLRPLFKGLSLETLIGRIRSALSLHSPRGSSKNSSHEHLPTSGADTAHETVVCRSHGGLEFPRLPDPNASSRENHSIAMEHSEKKAMRKDLPLKAIVVQEDLDQKAVQADDQV